MQTGLSGGAGGSHSCDFSHQLSDADAQTCLDYIMKQTAPLDSLLDLVHGNAELLLGQLGGSVAWAAACAAALLHFFKVSLSVFLGNLDLQSPVLHSFGNTGPPVARMETILPGDRSAARQSCTCQSHCRARPKSVQRCAAKAS